MELPICESCAKSGVLCSLCEEKLKQGKITKTDVEVAKAFCELGKDELGFRRAIETEEAIVILTERRNIGRVVGKGGENTKLLAEILGKQVRVVGLGSLEEMLQDLLSPAKLRSISTLYAPEGERVVVRVPKKYKRKVALKLKEVESILSKLLNKPVESKFE